MKPAVKIALGIFTSLATIGFIFFYDSFIKNKIDSAEVVVVKPGAEILKSDPITQDNLMLQRRPKETLVSGTILANQMKSILGYDANEDLIGNEIVSSDMVDKDGMVPNAKKGESIRPITKDMIYAEPGSLRRKDTIDIYLVDGIKNPNQSGNVASAVQQSSFGNKPFLQNVKVVYVKDSNNKEVISPQDEKTDDKRLDATSKISDLEVILNEDDFQGLMKQVVGNGAKLYITYH
ncbi:hypothetical protein HPT25_26250 [Bacillus sp. BRMEA1]|uniref:hypothetical protein n=1 Tax=Neobacillus endophyticus TaxID=2738405 RepID=UPI0015655D8B|nr:hypothetical protein [Neobacillus endophyticus]NRD80833.1 hypothetical protein [Neobacillus endophyticus]